MSTTDMTLREALAQYKTRVAVLKKGYAQEKYRIERMQQAGLAEKIVREITSVDIAAYRDERLQATNPRTGKTLAASTVRLELALLSHLFELGMIEWGICDANPVTKIRKPKLPPGRDRRLTPREERRIMRYCHGHVNPEIGAIVTLALESAMRQSEILSLDWGNINLKGRVARLPDTKNGTSRDVPLSLKARDILVSMGPKVAGRVFSFKNTGLKSSWRFMIQRLGIKDLHFHDLRHEAVSRLFELGTLDLMEIASVSGHKSLSMLKRYTHLKASSIAKKMEAPKNRGRAAVLSAMVPYPAQVAPTEDGIQVRLLDFEDLVVKGKDKALVIEAARDTLLRSILQMMRDGLAIPSPDQYLDPIDEQEVIMLDPLAPADVQVVRQNFSERSKDFPGTCPL